MAIRLLEIAHTLGANKIREEVCHYCDEYEAIMPRGKPLRLLEIGVQSGRSILMWRAWLGKRAHLGGIDIGGIPPDCGLDWQYEGPQADPATLIAATAAGPWDIIIDDGSHAPMDQIVTLRALWAAVAANGWYCIEDCMSSYWPREGEGNTVQWVGDHLHDLNVWARRHKRSNSDWQRRPVDLPGLRKVVAVKHLIMLQREGWRDADDPVFQAGHLVSDRDAEGMPVLPV